MVSSSAVQGGRLIFLLDAGGTAGELFLRRLALELAPRKPAILIAGKFDRGRYLPADTKESGFPLAEALGIAQTAAGWIHPLAGQVIGLSKGAHALYTKLDSAAARQDPADALGPLLSAAARDAPVLLLVAAADRSDDPQQDVVRPLLLTLGQRIQEELPIVLLAGLEGDPSSQTEQAWASKRLEERGLAERWPMPPLTASDLYAWLGENASRELVDALQETARGQDAATLETWLEWRSQRAIVEDIGGIWRLADDVKRERIGLRSVVDHRLPQLLGEPPVQMLEKAREILACAALEGLAFTAPAVATALERTADEVINFLDDHLVRDDERPDGLVDELGLIGIPTAEDKPRYLACYAFTSEFIRADLAASLTRSERIERSRALADSLIVLYAGTRTKAHEIAELLAAAGDAEGAAQYAAQASFDHTRQETIISLRLLTAQVPRSLTEARFLRERLFNEVVAARRRTPAIEALAAFERVYALSSDPKHGAKELACAAQIGTADAFIDLHRGEEAKARAEGAVALAETISAREFLANALRFLSIAQWMLGDPHAAKASLERSLAARELPNALLQLAGVERELGDEAEARRLLERAVTLARREENEYQLLAILFADAEDRIDRYEHPTGLLREALSLAEKLDDKLTEAKVRVEVARLMLADGDARAAGRDFLLAGEIASELDDKLVTFAAYVGYARALRALGEDAKAEEVARMAAWRADYGQLSYRAGERQRVQRDAVSMVREVWDKDLNELYKETTGAEVPAFLLKRPPSN